MKKNKSKLKLILAFFSLVLLIYFSVFVIAVQYTNLVYNGTSVNIGIGKSNVSVSAYNQTWLSFDGGYASVNNTNAISWIQNNLTYSGVVRIKLGNNPDRSTILCTDYDLHNTFNLGYLPTTGNLTLSQYNGSTHLNIKSIAPITNQWISLVYNNNGTTVRFYQNGTEAGVGSASSAGIAYPEWRVGHSCENSATTGINASIDYVKIYNYALTDSEIVALTNQQGIPAFENLKQLPFIGADQHSFEACGDYLWFVAGRSSPSHSNKTYRYNPLTNVWNEMADLPIAIQSPSMRCYNNQSLILVGGVNSETSTIYNRTYKYSLASNNWTRMSDSPYSFEDFGSAIVGNNFYAFGGLCTACADVYISMNLTKIYNITNDSWSVGTTVMPERKWSGDFASTVGNKVYLIGSTNSFSGYPALTQVPTVHVYNTTDDTYTQLANMSSGKAYKEAEELNGLIYVFGGATTNELVYDNEMQIYNISGNYWNISNIRLPYASRGLGMAKLNGVLYLSGGLITSLGSSSGSSSTKSNYLFKYNFNSRKSPLFDLEFNENVNGVSHDLSASNFTGTVYQAVWNNDGINVSLSNITDYNYNSLNGLFSLLNLNYNFNYLMMSYEDLQPPTILSDTCIQLENLYILAISMLGLIIFVSIIMIIVRIIQSYPFDNFIQHLFYILLLSIIPLVLGLIILEAMFTGC